MDEKLTDDVCKCSSCQPQFVGMDWGEFTFGFEDVRLQKRKPDYVFLSATSDVGTPDQRKGILRLNATDHQKILDGFAKIGEKK